ncbi:MAG TPA: hypothetical protein VF256_04960 [Streptosporangiaceae bacterium]
MPMPADYWRRCAPTAAEDARHAAYADREAARRERFAARPAHERASAVVERLLTDRLAKMP